MKYFGTDGIRGKAGEFLTADLAFRLGRALAQLHNRLVVIGRDTRESGPLLRDSIAAGAKSVGIDVLDLGIVSTPMLSYLSARQDAIGIMITASHNPYIDNGIKVFHKGLKLYAGEELGLEAVLNGQAETRDAIRAGIDRQPIDAFEIYRHLYDTFLVPTKLKIALDLANGATYRIGPAIFGLMTKHLTLTGDSPDGMNINEGVGSTHIDHLSDLVKRQHLDYGFAFDGDGDRILAVDGEGRIYDGDQLIYVVADYLNKRHLLQDSTVVLTKMSNLGILKALEKRQIKVLLTDVGDKYVLEAMETHQLTVGGENSGHLINRRLLNTGDGVLNAAFLIRILEDTRQTLSELTRDIVMFPDRLVNLKNVDRSLVDDSEVLAMIQRWKQRLGTDGKVLVRASGTEPLIRVSVSAITDELVLACQQEIVSLIERLNHR